MGQMPLLVNAHWLMCSLGLLLHYSSRVESLKQRKDGLQSLRYSLAGPLRNSLPALGWGLVGRVDRHPRMNLTNKYKVVAMTSAMN